MLNRAYDGRIDAAELDGVIQLRLFVLEGNCENLNGKRKRKKKNLSEIDPDDFDPK